MKFHKEFQPQLIKLCEESHFLYEKIDNLVEEKEKLVDELLKIKSEFELVEKENNKIKSLNIQILEEQKTNNNKEKLTKSEMFYHKQTENNNLYILNPDSNNEMENHIFEKHGEKNNPTDLNEIPFNKNRNECIRESKNESMEENENKNLKANDDVKKENERLNLINLALQKEIEIHKSKIIDLQNGIINKETKKKEENKLKIENDNEKKIILQEILNINKEQLSEIKTLKENISQINTLNENSSSMGIILEETIKNIDSKINILSKYETKFITQVLNK